MVVKSMTIGIELTLTTTPGNGHQLAPIGRLTVQSKFPSPLGLILWIPVISSPTRTLHPFWGNFRVGGDSPETSKFVALALDSSLGDLA